MMVSRTNLSQQELLGGADISQPRRNSLDARRRSAEDIAAIHDLERKMSFGNTISAEEQERRFNENARSLTKQIRSPAPTSVREVFGDNALALTRKDSGTVPSRRESEAVEVTFHLDTIDEDSNTTLQSLSLTVRDEPLQKKLSGTAPVKVSIQLTETQHNGLERKKTLSINEKKGEDDPDWHTDPRKGLTVEEAAARREKYGFNEVLEVKIPAWRKFLSYFTGSIAYLIEIAIVLSGALQDWTDFGIITGLLFVNAFIGFIEESRAESAVEALRNTLAQKCRVMRNGQLVEEEARLLVPGDIINLRLGDVIPGDARLLGLSANGEATRIELQVDQSALTGESLPVTKRGGDDVWGSSIVKQGQMLAVVTKTGARSYIGRVQHLMGTTTESGHFQSIVNNIGNFLIILSLILVVIILIVAAARDPSTFVHQLQYALILTIASIPVGLPTVLSVTMAVGAKQLASKKVIVKRLTAVEEMAGLDVLCSDKTGTLTLNQLSLDEPYLATDRTHNDLLLAAYLASEPGANDAIEICVRTTAVNTLPELKGVQPDSQIVPGHRVLHFQPFDPISKLTRATCCKLPEGASSPVNAGPDAEVFNVAKGAPQVILKMCNQSNSPEPARAIAQMASKGLRALGVARSKPMRQGDREETIEWELVGILSLLDPPRHDSGDTIRSCQSFGLSVKMITGDAQLIAKEVARRLGMQRVILTPGALNRDKTHGVPEEQIAHLISRADGFAQVVPEDKFRVVQLLQEDGHMVGMTGDGVNDAPALKKANVGIAVDGATDAARSAASIVLLQPGLSAIVDGIMTSRQIFQRMRSYALYRITSTIHFIVFLFFTIIIWNFSIQAVLIVMIAMLNDAAVLVISVDNALISQKPDKWRMGQMLTLSTILGILLVAASFAHFLIGKYVFELDDGVLGTIMYLQMSSCPHFVIFSTRLQQPFYKQPPSFIFFVAVLGTQIFAMFISVYGVLSPACGWPWALVVMAISLTYFMLLDFVKCWLYSKWNFELTTKLWPCNKAAQEKLERRRALKIADDRFKGLVRRVRKVVKATAFARKLPHYHPLPEAIIDPKKVHGGHH